MTDIVKYIDSTLLKPEATEADIAALCEEAFAYRFASVCVNPYWAALVSERLAGSGIATCCVVGFPLGATGSEVKVAETAYVLAHGATEVDMVMNVGALRSGRPDAVRDDIRAVVERVGERGLVKVILECCLLTDEEKAEAAELAVAAGAAFVKTSTGFSTGGATVEDVRLLKRTVGERARVKASGGVRDLAAALAMIEAGADRIGTSAGAAIARAASGGEG
ncbi:MAG: deoxyribose-phosphate aldolase [Candidatus Geothermincolia bacterium]